MNQERLNRLIRKMEKNNIPQMLISDPIMIFYLTGRWFSPGERMLVLYLNLTEQPCLFLNQIFLVDSIPDVEVVTYNDIQDPVELLFQHVDKEKPMGIDKNWAARFLLHLMELNGESRFFESSFLLDQMRLCKDNQEIALMRASSKINDLAMAELIQFIGGEVSEQNLSQLLLSIYNKYGAGYSFDPIIAFGIHTANPHHQTGDAHLKMGDSITLDIGGRKDSYCSDMTRTVFYRSASSQAVSVYQAVLEANKRAIDRVKPGVRFCDIDTAARESIETAGYGRYFTHRTGHSIGLEYHEYGDVSSKNEERLCPGMIFSIEPGIYLPGNFGVRIEDLVLVTDNSCEVLNSYDKKLTIVG